MSIFSMTNYIIFFCTFGDLKKKDLNKKIGQRVVHLREEKGLTQAELSRACGKDRQAIEKLEGGRVNPTLYTLYEISRALNLSLPELVDQLTK